MQQLTINGKGDCPVGRRVPTNDTATGKRGSLCIINTYPSQEYSFDTPLLYRVRLLSNGYYFNISLL
jgi:hypothetical protein